MVMGYRLRKPPIFIVCGFALSVRAWTIQLVDCGSSSMSSLCSRSSSCSDSSTVFLGASCLSIADDHLYPAAQAITTIAKIVANSDVITTAADHPCSHHKNCIRL
ncbi:hypothetical protein B296_00040357 [Ensete ventricosum]|uniref:Uncharacterized protein n=1 Tax=Ensete ventricosum TaxID=4639 RepID=A0A426ZQU1_ENSVE|nr:hypothetical protein B296_00040357 [Ensete ventricosum]